MSSMLKKAFHFEIQHREYEGFLHKESRTFKKMRERWVVLTPNCIFTFERRKEYEKPTQTIFLNDLISVGPAKLPSQFTISTKDASFLFAADSSEDCLQWTKTINIVKNRDKSNIYAEKGRSEVLMRQLPEQIDFKKRPISDIPQVQAQQLPCQSQSLSKSPSTNASEKVLKSQQSIRMISHVSNESEILMFPSYSSIQVQNQSNSSSSSYKSILNSPKELQARILSLQQQFDQYKISTKKEIYDLKTEHQIQLLKADQNLKKAEDLNNELQTRINTLERQKESLNKELQRESFKSFTISNISSEQARRRVMQDKQQIQAIFQKIDQTQVLQRKVTYFRDQLGEEFKAHHQCKFELNEQKNHSKEELSSHDSRQVPSVAGISNMKSEMPYQKLLQRSKRRL